MTVPSTSKAAGTLAVVTLAARLTVTKSAAVVAPSASLTTSFSTPVTVSKSIVTVIAPAPAVDPSACVSRTIVSVPPLPVKTSVASSSTVVAAVRPL